MEIIIIKIIEINMASQLTEFHYHATQGGKANLFNFEEKNFDIKDIYNYYLRKVGLISISESTFTTKRFI